MGEKIMLDWEFKKIKDKMEELQQNKKLSKNHKTWLAIGIETLEWIQENLKYITKEGHRAIDNLEEMED